MCIIIKCKYSNGKLFFTYVIGANFASNSS